MGCVVLAGMAILTGEREHRLAWRLLLWFDFGVTALLAIASIALIVSAPVIGVVNALVFFLLFGAFPTMGVMAWRRLHRDTGAGSSTSTT